MKSIYQELGALALAYAKSTRATRKAAHCAAAYIRDTAR